MRKFFRDKNWEYYVIGGSPRILGSTCPKPEVLGNLRYDRDPNPRLNVGNCLRVELSVRTSADTKLGTSRTGRVLRV